MFPWQTAQVKALGHPYYPLGSIVSGYTPNQTDVTTLILYLSTCIVGFVSVTALAIRAKYPTISGTTFSLAVWFAFAGFIHISMQGYSAYNFARIPGATDILGQLWKEYAKGDSRYVTQDALPFSIDALSAIVLGPLCLYTAYLTANDAPFRHPLTLAVSASQLCAHVIYCATAVFEERVHGKVLSRPEPEYYWGCFVWCNAVWIIASFACIVHSSRVVAGLVQRSKDAEKVAREYLRSGRTK